MRNTFLLPPTTVFRKPHHRKLYFSFTHPVFLLTHFFNSFPHNLSFHSKKNRDSKEREEKLHKPQWKSDLYSLFSLQHFSFTFNSLYIFIFHSYLTMPILPLLYPLRLYIQYRNHNQNSKSIYAAMIWTIPHFIPTSFIITLPIHIIKTARSTIDNTKNFSILPILPCHHSYLVSFTPRVQIIKNHILRHKTSYNFKQFLKSFLSFLLHFTHAKAQN